MEGSAANKLEIYKDDLPEVYSSLVDAIGIDNVIKLAKLLGGQYVYFQKLETVERPLRDRKIKNEFNGYNFSDLAKKYNLSEISIRNICSDIVNRKRVQPLKDQVSIFE